MSRRTIITKRIKATGNHVLEIEMYYSPGGQNMFNGMKEPRGYWLSVTPIEIDTNTHLEAITLGRGRKMFLAQTKIGGLFSSQPLRKASIRLEQYAPIQHRQNTRNVKRPMKK